MVCNVLCLLQWLVLFLFLAFGQVRASGADGTEGTTAKFKDKFLSRCQTFQNHNPEQFKDNPKNCTRLYDIFLKSFASKAPCDVHPENYSEFLRAANHTLSIRDKALFYAYVYPFVYNFTDSQRGQYTTINDLLSGYILGPMKWCWDLTKNDFNYKSCPAYKTCTQERTAVRSFWKATSKNFADLSNGTVYAMLNGSIVTGAFTDKSIFYTVEVPSMTSPRITKMNVILVQCPGGPFSEFCNNGSTISILKNKLNSTGIAFNCTENPTTVLDLFPKNASDCPNRGAASGHLSSSLFGTILFLCIIMFLLHIAYLA